MENLTPETYNLFTHRPYAFKKVGNIFNRTYYIYSEENIISVSSSKKDAIHIVRLLNSAYLQGIMAIISSQKLNS